MHHSIAVTISADKQRIKREREKVHDSNYKLQGAGMTQLCSSALSIALVLQYREQCELQGRVSAYSGTFSSRHNNSPAPTLDRYTHLPLAPAQQLRGLGTHNDMLST